MIPELRNMIKVVTTTEGLGPFVSSPTPVHGPFGLIYLAPVVGDDGKTFRIGIYEVDTNGNFTGNWEICDSVYTHSTLSWSRGTLIKSSTGSRIDFGAGRKYIEIIGDADLLSHFVYSTTDQRSGTCILQVDQLSLGPDNSHTYQVSVDASGNATLTATGNVTIAPATSVVSIGTGPIAGFGTLIGLNIGILGAAYISVSDGTHTTFFGADTNGTIFGSATNHDLNFRTNNTVRMRLTTGGAAAVDTVTAFTDGSGVNSVGSTLTLKPGVSTGNAFPASVIIQSTVAGSNGSTPQTLSDTVVITNGKIILPAPHGYNPQIYTEVDAANSGVDCLRIVPAFTGERLYFGTVSTPWTFSFAGVNAIESMPPFLVGDGLHIGTNDSHIIRRNVNAYEFNTSFGDYVWYSSATNFYLIGAGDNTEKMRLTATGTLVLNTSGRLVVLGSTASPPGMAVNYALYVGGGINGSILSAAGIEAGSYLQAASYVKPGSYTVAGLPTGVTGAMVYCSNLRVFNGTGTQQTAGNGTGGHVLYNGTNWVNADAQSVTAVA